MTNNELKELDVEKPVTKKRKAPSSADPMLKELVAIKRLLCVMLMKAGTSHAELAVALQMDRADVSRILPAKKFNAFNRQR